VSEGVAVAALEKQRLVHPSLNLDLFAKQGLFVAKDLFCNGATWIGECECQRGVAGGHFLY